MLAGLNENVAERRTGSNEKAHAGFVHEKESANVNENENENETGNGIYKRMACKL